MPLITVFHDVNQNITKVAKFDATWSEDLQITFFNLQTQVQSLPDGAPKQLLLRNIDDTELKLIEIQHLERIFSQTGSLLAKATKKNGYPSSHWSQAFVQLEQAAVELKKLPKSLRTNSLATHLGNDTDNGINLLNGMIVSGSKGDKTYMAAREKDYVRLRDFIISMAGYLPNQSALTNAVKRIKNDNNFSSKTFCGRVFPKQPIESQGV